MRTRSSRAAVDKGFHPEEEKTMRVAGKAGSKICSACRKARRKCIYNDPSSRCSECIKAFSPCGPKLTLAEQKQKENGVRKHLLSPGSSLTIQSSHTSGPSISPFSNTNGKQVVDYFHALLSSEGATFILKEKLVGSLSCEFPQLDKARLWGSVERALENFRHGEVGEVEKLGMLKINWDEMDNSDMCCSTTTLSSLESERA